MKVTQTRLDGVLLIEPAVYRDERGLFLESYSKSKYQKHGIDVDFVQDNHSISNTGVLRGLHYQVNTGQAKLVRVVQGEVFDVAVDIRRDSPTFGQWVGYHLSAENMLQMYIPVGFAHGFCALSDGTQFLYKCSDYYSTKDERGLIWNDPDIGIDWPIKNPTLSPKDLENSLLRDL
ncbi:MAG: dTDP-4-dehydrorhamnose 3,5-epimerase [Nitrospinales bacterium]